MDLLTPSALRELSSVRGSHCLSLYLTLTKVSDREREDGLHLRHLLERAEKTLWESGVDDATVKRVLAGPSSLTPRELSWRTPGQAVALFVSDAFWRMFSLPEETQDMAAVGGQFHILPLLKAIRTRERYLVLAISRNGARLLTMTEDGGATKEVPVPGMPKNVDDALRDDEHEQHLQFHTVGGHGQIGMYHGQGGVKDADEMQIHQYLVKVAKALMPFLEHRRGPLLFAGVDELWGVFRKVCHYPRLLPDPLKGNVDELDGKELHKKALPLFAKHRQDEDRELRARFEKLSHNYPIALDLQTILGAAVAGRVSLLLLAEGTECWGKVGADGRIMVESSNKDGCMDLLNLAAIHTIAHGGEAEAVERAAVPEGKEAVAALRW